LSKYIFLGNIFLKKNYAQGKRNKYVEIKEIAGKY